jgi:hypothetical protein
MNKLYTQSEVERAIIEFIKNEYTLSHPNLDKVISTLTPIELPSDDVIKHLSNHPEQLDLKYIEGFCDGADWLMDKLKGGNNE